MISIESAIRINDRFTIDYYTYLEELIGSEKKVKIMEQAFKKQKKSTQAAESASDIALLTQAKVDLDALVAKKRFIIIFFDRSRQLMKMGFYSFSLIFLALGILAYYNVIPY